MKPDSRLANCIDKEDFIVTAEYLPRAGTNPSVNEVVVKALNGKIQAVNVADNPYGIVTSSLAGSFELSRSGIEPVYQIVTRDRNRIAIQSDLLGAASLGIKNVLCLSGYHQALTGCPESANVYDIDSIQLVAAVSQMRDEGVLLDGTKIEGEFSMLVGAAASPYLRPMELNILRLAKKVEAGARFIQTQAVFDVQGFAEWVNAARGEGITAKTAILVGVLPLNNATEAEELRERHTDFHIPDEIIERLKKAGDQGSQQKEGVVIAAEIIKEVKNMKGIRGVHVLSGGKETAVPELLAASGL
ncbi:MAG: methylenetetrahydrofolate reductase [Sedimentisphaerales bacterium]